jgi:hypothetical protein
MKRRWQVDESVYARDEAEAIYNETRALQAGIDKKEQSIGLLQEKTELDSKATAARPAQAGVFLNKTEEVYNRIQALSIQIENNHRQINSALREAIDLTNSSANDSAFEASAINASLPSSNLSR